MKEGNTISSGFVLLLVLWTLVILSTIALTLAASVGTEVRAGQDAWDDLQAERLAKSGHEVATYIEGRALGTPSEDLSDLPVKAIIPGLKYSATFDAGTVDIVLEGENGRLDLASATEEATATVFTAWTGDTNRGREIAASIADWVDSNDDPRPFGGESGWYSNRGYLPRNGGLGSADLFLVKGLTPEDFTPALTTSEDAPTLRIPLARMISTASTRNVNPNYAAPDVLRYLPGMTPGILARILQLRQVSPFTSAQDFQTRVGTTDTPLLSQLAFTRGTAPAVRAVARLRNSGRERSERRVKIQLIDRSRPARPPLLSLIEHDIGPE